MSRVSYFQRFSQKENTATNNTLLLFRHFYQEDPGKFEKTMSGLCNEQMLSVGVQFAQQVRQGNSIPDGVISQSAFEILFETKNGKTLDENQIERHLEGDEKENNSTKIKILFGLTTSSILEKDRIKYEKMANKKGVVFKAITFADIVAELRSTLAPYEKNLHTILDDYEAYLVDDNLVPEGEVLYVIPCGISMKENVKHKIYFEPSHRWSKAQAKFLGLYADKTVQHIGQIATVVNGVFANEEFSLTSIEIGNFTDEVAKTISSVIEDCQYFPNFAQEEHRYYLFSELHKTEFKKSTAGGIWGPRKFYTKDLVGDCNTATAESLSAALTGKTFN